MKCPARAAGESAGSRLGVTFAWRLVGRAVWSAGPADWAGTNEGRDTQDVDIQDVNNQAWMTSTT
jgi:hypothetical protein